MNDRINLDFLKEIVDDVVTTCGFSLVEIRLGGTPRRSTLKVFIYSHEGVGVDDCARISRELGTVLDDRDLFPSKYVLQVSSPGAERIIKGSEELELFRGREIKVAVDDETNEQQEIIGRIREVINDDLKLEVVGSGEVTIPLRHIRKARLYMDRNRIAKRSPDEF